MFRAIGKKVFRCRVTFLSELRAPEHKKSVKIDENHRKSKIFLRFQVRFRPKCSPYDPEISKTTNMIELKFWERVLGVQGYWEKSFQVPGDIFERATCS